ncbi:hypothetical protein INT45_010016 [Circinella minor]|uniref:F-box domain-containing protein n=1 Tax=Circinella minor TaxID=1195481 RepID=A0A8H7VLU3_9FUNG|nr:hypothetical protein INT45_010016 [Circinella minor]
MNKRKQLQLPEETPEPKRPAYSMINNQQHMRISPEVRQCLIIENGTGNNVAIDAPESTMPISDTATTTATLTTNVQATRTATHGNSGNILACLKKYDFIDRLPTDVIGDILSRLSFKERHACMAVCKAWNIYLSSWPGMWREIDICLVENASDEWLQWIPKPETGHKIRRLRFFGNSVQMKKAFDVLAQREQKRIQSLVIGSFYAWDTVDIPPAEQLDSFSGLLDMIGPNLINLEFRNADFPADMVMDKIFPVCKQLQRLICVMDYDNGSLPPDNWSPPNNTTLPCLTELLWSTEMILPLDKFLPRCPNLRALIIESSEFGDTHVLQRLDKLCPTLQHFSTTDTETINTNLDQTINMISLHTINADVGLRAVSIDHVNTLKDDDIIPLIQRHHDTLAYLSIYSDVVLNRYWSIIASLGSPQLTTLDLRHQGPVEQLCQMILRSPLLQDVTLYYPVSSQIMDTLTQLKHLQKLKIHEGSSDATEGAIRFAQSCSLSSVSTLTTSAAVSTPSTFTTNTTDSSSKLTSINFAHSKFVTDHLLLLLAKIQTLQTIIVGDCPLLTTAGILKFVTQAKQVQILGIYGLDAVTDEVVKTIGNNMDHLQQLDISRCQFVTDIGVKQLFFHNKNNDRILKKLVVQGCPSIGEHSIALIERELGFTAPLFATSLF